MIHTKISRSKQVNQMSEFAQLLFTWSIAHADDFGCMSGDPEVVLATVIPMKRDKSPEDVVEAIGEWVAARLVYWYSVEGELIIQFCSWEVHQSGLHKRTKPKYPLYDDAKCSESFREIHGNSSLREEKRRELNRTELNGTEEEEKDGETSALAEVAVTTPKTNDMDSSSSLDQKFGQVFTMYQAEGFGQITPIAAEKMQVLCEEYGHDWVKDAIKESVFRNKRSIDYMHSILRNWRTEGGVRLSMEVSIGTAKTRDGPKQPVKKHDERYGKFYELFPDG